MSNVTLPPPREPAIDPRTNTFSRNWILYFQQLFNRVGGVVAEIVTLADFTGENHLLSPNGFQKLPGGLIQQWGTATLNADASVEIVFPTPFLSACYGIYCEETGATSASGITFSHGEPTLLGTVIYGSGAGTENAVKTFNWKAMGK